MAILELPDKLFDTLTKLADEQQITIPTLLKRFIDDNAIDKQYFQAYMDSVPLVVYIKDANFNHLYGNSYLIDAVEKQGGEYQHKTPLNIMTKDISDKIKLSDLKVLETNDIVVLDDYAIGNSEHRNWYKEVKFPIEGTDGKRYIGGFAIDITKQKQIEEEQQLLLDRSPIPTAIALLDNKIVYLNEVFTETFGYTLDDIPDIATWALIVYPNRKYRKQVTKEWSTDIEHARNTNNLIPPRNYTITDKFGKEHIVTIQSSIVDNRIFTTFIDITEQHRMQEAITRSEAQYRSLFENAFFPIILYDGDANILMINSAGAKNLNHPVADIIGRPLGDFLPDEHETTVKLIRQVMDSGETLYLESEIQLQDKQVAFWSVLQPIFDKDQKITSVQVLAYDITEQRRAEELQKKQAQLELTLTKERQISDLRTRLLTTISHEFRTPLTIIQTNSEMLIRYDDRFSQTQKEEKLNHIIAQIHHLVGMLDNVRTVNQSEHKELPFTPETVDLKRFLQRLKSEVANIQHPEQILTIHSNISHEIAQFDPNLMQQALLNLLKNAVKYSPDNGKIDLYMSLSQDFLNIKIQDEGIGIPDSELVRIYQPFYRAENVAHIRGTGLSLAIVKKVIDLHRGTIICESRVNQGTTFTIQLPLKCG